MTRKRARRGHRRRAAAWAASLLLASIAIAPGDAHAPAAWASSPGGSLDAPVSPPPAPASLPPALQALEQKMENLRVNSERYTQTIRGGAIIAVELKGKHGRRVKRRRRSLGVSELGEVSLSPAEGQVFAGADRSRPSLIMIGATLYDYSPKIARQDGGRPWIRSRSPGFADSDPLFPNHGRSGEVNLGGTGAYAGLVNLLATALGPVATVGQATVDGQQTSEFAAVVEPLRLIKGLPPKMLKLLRRHRTAEKLEVFITEAGLPLRVRASIDTSSSSVSETTDILAVNAPVDVKRPPARRTIGQAEFIKLLRRKHALGGFLITTGQSTGESAIAAPPAVKRAGGRELAEFKLGRTVMAQSGCLACHRIGGEGNRRPGRPLTNIGSVLSRRAIEHALVDPSAPMPSFKHLPAARFKALVEFLSELRKR
jgi:mono/diheme cytochrome c family protein